MNPDMNPEMSTGARVTLYSKPGCHLCDDARRVIEQVGAFGQQSLAVGDRLPRLRMQAAVGERVGRHVDDAHDPRYVQVDAKPGGLPVHGAQPLWRRKTKNGAVAPSSLI